MSVEQTYKENDVPSFTANTWPEFLDCIRQARSGLGNPETVWYRAMSRAEFKLVPCLLRIPNGLRKEQDLFNEYERSVARITAKRSNDWELLIDMQHYGIPTRLLDWTDVLGVAIAFALYDTKVDDRDSSIHVLDPLKLNSKSCSGEIRRPANDQEFNYKSIYWHDRPFNPVYPIAIDGPFQNERMVAQQVLSHSTARRLISSTQKGRLLTENSHDAGCKSRSARVLRILKFECIQHLPRHIRNGSPHCS